MREEIELFSATVGKNGVKLKTDKCGKTSISITINGRQWTTVGVNREVLSLLHTATLVGISYLSETEEKDDEDAD